MMDRDEIFIDRDPLRGCGKKEYDAYYLEGDPPRPGGGLNAWTWFLGDGVDTLLVVNQSQIPHRGSVTINPAATLTLEEFIPGDFPLSFSEKEEERYDHYLYRTRMIGSADYVGSASYTAFGFAYETQKYGPSRRVTGNQAKVFAELFEKWGPIPMIFSHSNIPVFRNVKHLCNVYQLAVDAIFYDPHEKLWAEPTWFYNEWGQYARRNQETGYRHYMVPILKALAIWQSRPDHLKDMYETAKWKQLVNIFEGDLVYHTQIFGASWLTKITYTLPQDDDGTAGIYAREEIPGIEILDLDAHEKEKEKYETAI